MSNAELLTMAEFSARAGVAPSAIRFYEAQGLIEATRTGGNQRRFARTELRRVGFIRTAQQVGLTLDEVSEALASLPRGRTPTRADWQLLSSQWRPRLDARIAHLEKLRDKLDSCIGCGCLSLKRCGLANPDDQAGRTGNGPVFLQRETI
ncbi:MAG: redox-sensitive transcriptional activator SoxR [Propionibacteriales bacterium]|nr:redox-sensitive transcriptional activator SoxR [Propionibacteriales bacterium]